MAAGAVGGATHPNSNPSQDPKDVFRAASASQRPRRRGYALRYLACLAQFELAQVCLVKLKWIPSSSGTDIPLYRLRPWPLISFLGGQHGQGPSLTLCLNSALHTWAPVLVQAFLDYT